MYRGTVLRSHSILLDYELGRLLSREGDDKAARQQFDLVLSGKPLEATTHARKGKYSMEVGGLLTCREIWLTCRISKHFICARMLLSMHSVVIDSFSIRIPALCLTIERLISADAYPLSPGLQLCLQ
jgi:hypothetical protein